MRLIACFFLLVLIAAASSIVWRAPQRYALQERDAVSVGQTPDHPAGTDELGRDRATRIAVALLLGFVGAGLASAIGSLLAMLLGGAAAFAPRFVGQVLLYTGDLFLTLPWLFLLMLVRSALPLTLSPAHSALLTFLMLAVLSVPAFLRLNFEKVSSLLRTEWFLHARASGLRSRQLTRQLLPHLLPILLTQFLLFVPGCLMAEADLGTLGLGITEPLPSWGSMLGTLQSAALSSNSHLIYLPLVLLAVTLFALEMLVFSREV